MPVTEPPTARLRTTGMRRRTLLALPALGLAVPALLSACSEESPVPTSEPAPAAPAGADGAEVVTYGDDPSQLAELYRPAGASRGVVVVIHDVRAGDRIESSDLATTQLRGGDEVQTVPGSKLSSLVGKRAVQSMPSGSLVSESDFANRITPRSGDAVVPIPVTSGQYPASGLQRGDVIRVVVTGGGQSVEGLEPGTTFNGVVLALGDADEKGTMTVDVSISTTDAPSAAAAAGTGRISIINVAPGGTGEDG